MKKIIITTVVCLISVSAYAENNLLGIWKDKSEPLTYQYEFKEDNDFIYIHKWKYKGKQKSIVYKGVWEIGEWTIKRSTGINSRCNLTIYAGKDECCFEFKFVGDNLILSNKYDSDSNGSMCENRVLVK